MRVLVTGSKGQLGRAIQGRLQEHDLVFPVDLPECDVTDRECLKQIAAGFKPDVIVHTAAMTDVDGCARDPDAAYRSNALGAENVGRVCLDARCPMLYVSTNEVFDGRKTEPYVETDTTNPVNAYGRSKLAGEVFVRGLLTGFYVVRTAWLYGKGGNHFARKVVRRADEQGSLRVVSDEVGSPTYAEDAADAICRLIRTDAFGVYHFVNDGIASRFDFASEVLRLTGRRHVPVEPIKLADFSRPSTPPPYTPLRNTCGAALGITLRAWQDALAEYLASGDL